MTIWWICLYQLLILHEVINSAWFQFVCQFQFVCIYCTTICCYFTLLNWTLATCNAKKGRSQREGERESTVGTNISEQEKIWLLGNKSYEKNIKCIIVGLDCRRSWSYKRSEFQIFVFSRNFISSELREFAHNSSSMNV